MGFMPLAILDTDRDLLIIYERDGEFIMVAVDEIACFVSTGYVHKPKEEKI